MFVKTLPPLRVLFITAEADPYVKIGVWVITEAPSKSSFDLGTIGGRTVEIRVAPPVSCRSNQSLPLTKISE
jgi:hypothetical protein